MSKKAKDLSINLGISSANIVLILFTSIFISVFSFMNFRTAMRNDLKKRIHDIASVGVSMINGDIHDTLVDDSKIGNYEYKEIQKNIVNIRTRSTDIRWGYTMRKNPNGSYGFVVDDILEEGEEPSPIGFEVEPLTDALRQVFEKHDKTYVEGDFYTDEWGTWLSAYAPFFNSRNELSGVFGIDVSAKKVIESENALLLSVIIISIIVTTISIIIGFYVAKRITSPLQVLEKDLEKIQKLQIEDNKEISTVFKEIKSMNATFSNMKNSLRSFRKYVPADLVAELITMNQEAKLGGSRKKLTLFFSDIKNFTTFTEQTTPETTVEILARYFGSLTKIVLDNNGTVDKYIGDCIMAFWNAPKNVEDHAFQACKTALGFQAFLKDFDTGMKNPEFKRFVTRVGLNTGDAVVGNIGYENRFNYTVIGDSVNLASRLESLNKAYGTNIMLSQYTYEDAKDLIVTRVLDNVVVKGKTEGISVHELLAIKAEATQEQFDVSGLHNQAMQNYFAQNWDGALGLFSEVQKIRPNDYASTVLMARCTEYKNNPPGKSWNGVHEMTEK